MSNRSIEDLSDQEVKNMSNNGKGILMGLVIVALIFAFVGYKMYSIINKEKPIYVHNPYDFDMNIEINDIETVLQPDYTVKIKLEEGKNHFISKIGDSILIDTLINVSNIIFEKGG